MNLIAELHRSNLDPQVVSMLATRLPRRGQVKQSEHDAVQLQRLSEQTERDAVALKQLSERTQRDAAYIKTADLTIAALTLLVPCSGELAHHKRIRFANKSEAFTPEQRELFQETWNVDLAAIEAEVERVAVQIASPSQPVKARPTGRQPLPAHLPRIEHRHLSPSRDEPASCSCASCGADLVKIGEDISEQLDVEPARFFVHRHLWSVDHIRPQYACRTCETVTAQAIPPAVIQGSLGAPGLHAWVAVHLSPFAGEVPRSLPEKGTSAVVPN